MINFVSILRGPEPDQKAPQVCRTPPRTWLKLRMVTDAVKGPELISLAVTRRLFQGEDGKGNEVLEIAALRARITRAWDISAVIVQLWHARLSKPQ